MLGDQSGEKCNNPWSPTRQSFLRRHLEKSEEQMYENSETLYLILDMLWGIIVLIPSLAPK